jgi:hypothetical protein
MVMARSATAMPGLYRRPLVWIGAKVVDQPKQSA